MTDDPFILPDYAHELTATERGLVLVVIQQMLAKRAEQDAAKAPVFDLRKWRDRTE